MLGGALEAFLWYFGRVTGGRNKGQHKKNNVLIILFNIIIFVIFLISLCGYYSVARTATSETPAAADDAGEATAVSESSEQKQATLGYLQSGCA